MAVVVVAKFKGDPKQLTKAYDDVDAALVEQTGSNVPPGVISHLCGVGAAALFVIDVWESEAAFRGMIENDQFEKALVGAGFPSPAEAEIEVLDLHAAIRLWPSSAHRETRSRITNRKRGEVMDYVAFLGFRPSISPAERDAALMRRAGWDYPQGIRLIAEYGPTAAGTQVVSIF